MEKGFSLAFAIGLIASETAKVVPRAAAIGFKLTLFDIRGSS